MFRVQNELPPRPGNSRNTWFGDRGCNISETAASPEIRGPKTSELCPEFRRLLFLKVSNQDFYRSTIVVYVEGCLKLNFTELFKNCHDTDDDFTAIQSRWRYRSYYIVLNFGYFFLALFVFFGGGLIPWQFHFPVSL